MLRQLVSAIASGLLLCSCRKLGRHDRDALSASAVGCYRLLPVGPWADSSFSYFGSSFASFHLGRVAVPKRKSLYRLDGLPKSPFDSMLIIRLWEADSLSDTVFVFSGDGFSSTRLAMTKDPQRVGWDARVSVFGDVGPDFEHPQGRARAVPIACSDTGRSVAPAT
jgi:hypothetical protein